MEQNIIIIAEEAVKRLDVFLSSNIEDLTRSAAKKLIDGNCVTVNDKSVKSSYSVCAGDKILVRMPEMEECSAHPEDIPIDIVYEDEDIAVINKAQGMTVHMGNGNTEGTLVNALLFHLNSLSGVGGVVRPGIVHRIDKDTSGLLVVAKNDRAHLSLSTQIAEKTCHREYIALLEGNVKEDSGVITTYIGRSPTDRVKMAVVSPEKGKIAITNFSVLKRYNGYTLCSFVLNTGRTHQIRVHARYMGNPIVGDPVYGIKKQRFSTNGQLLHAIKLILTHPATGENIVFEAPIPKHFKDILSKVEKL